MRMAAQNRVPNVIVVGHLDPIKQDHIFQLHRIPHHSFFPHNRTSPDKCAVANLRVMVNDARTPEIGRRENLCILRNPDILRRMIKFLRGKGGAQLQNIGTKTL